MMNTSRRIPPLHASVLSLLLALPAGAQAAETPQHLRLGYDVYVGGLKMGRMTLETDIKGDDYRVSVAAEAGDMLARLIKWSYTAEAEGTFGGVHGVAPRHFHSLRTLRDKSWDATLSYTAPYGARDTAVSFTQTPAPSPEDANAVPMDQRPGTVDLLSAAAAISRHAEGGDCASRLPVYDGRRRYDVVMESRPGRHIEKSDYTVFEGDAIGCHVAIVPVAGFKPAGRGSQNFWTAAPDGKPRGFDLWIGRPVPGGPVVPVRLEAGELFFTHVIGHLAQVEVVPPRP
ncbi:DUF3108 domain-containing protein [Nitrospirillum sp. BR 11828]|uniref:DUF3108 domain-containing protein n=1 Tax=Nitrospirillum sp. BR 11828 TaxID=3104325 RepID=UPI002ACA60BF|nr:DUF3108 domain-containing protein [Nitrospirillum sp. BR 11828]MDZ5647332.1 DUF3108 domain-containing protein [Nitrospirillum sp. BR 11828]